MANAGSTGKTSTILVATSCGFLLGSAFTYFLSVRRRRNANFDSSDDPSASNSSKSRSRSIPSLRGTTLLNSRPGLNNGGRSTKRSAYALARLAQHGVDIENSEHVGFLSSIVRELWPYIDAAGSKTVKEMLEPMFAEMMPGPLKSLKFVQLGEFCLCATQKVHESIPIYLFLHLPDVTYMLLSLLPQTLAKFPSNWTTS